MTYSTLALCSGRAAFEAIPHPKLSLDLRGIRARFEEQGIDVIDARVMLIVRLEREVTIARDGRILIKSADGPQAERLFDQVRRFVEA